MVSVEEQFNTSQSRFFGLELESPFDGLPTGFIARGRRLAAVARSDITDFGGNFVGGYSITPWPPSTLVRDYTLGLWGR